MQNTKENINMWLTQLRFKIETQEIAAITDIQIGSYLFVFNKNGLNTDQQEMLINFMKDYDNLLNLYMSDFCDLFIKNNIEFALKYKFAKDYGIKYNLMSLFDAIRMRKQLKKLEYEKYDRNKISNIR